MLIKNRFGRLVDVPEQMAHEMVKKGEATLVDEAPVETKETTINPLECVYCGKVYKNPTGLKIHQKACKKKAHSSQ